ncbi:hypothetical protein [uncultured Roseobacter sp.]|uniref:hypothetical protein n=1 Tax=uncultured Roseobacter sp. TaxID=114847 RepID=UPI00260EB476|nr:hypothetical protein [uncultured Roseobacter sp.]
MSNTSTKALSDLYANISFGGGGGGGSGDSGTGSGSNYDSGIAGSVEFTAEQQAVNRDYAATGAAAATGTAAGLGVTAATRSPVAGAAVGAMVARGTYDALTPE